MTIRLRIAELMKAKGYATAYELAKASGGRLSLSTAYRLVEAKGQVQNFSASTLEALADTFGVDVGDLFERTKAKR